MNNENALREQDIVRDPSGPAPTGNGIRPLTRTRKDSGAVYVREASVTRQIARIAVLPDRERRAALTGSYDSKDPQRPHEETLVYFIREYDRCGKKNAAWELIGALQSRITGHIGRELAKWRLPAADQEECVGDLIAAMYDAVLSEAPEAEFWEVRFWVCLDRKLHALAEKRQKLRDSEIRPADDFADEEESARGAEGVFASLADPNASPEVMAIRQELQKRLTELEWNALYLKYVEGMPEESGDPQKTTIARILGVTGRSVRNYLRKAERKLLEPTYGEA